MTLGYYGVLTLGQARDMAKVRLAKVINGIDPLAQRQKVEQGGTVKVLCKRFLNDHAKVKKKTWKEDEYKINKYIIPTWGSMKASAITAEDVSALHLKIGRKHKYQANRVVELLSKMFALSYKWGFLEKGAENPATDIDKFRERKRDRWVREEELPRLAEAINQEDNIYIKSAFWLYLLTGMRKSELLNAMWTDVDFTRNEIRLAETKAGRVHHVPLTDPAIRVLSALPRQQGNPYIFCGRREGQPLVEVRKAWVRIRKAAKLEDVRLHDLRRTVGSWLATSGASLPLIGSVLGHSNPSTTQIYARLGQDPARRALEGHAVKLMEIAEKREENETEKIQSGIV